MGLLLPGDLHVPVYMSKSIGKDTSSLLRHLYFNFRNLVIKMYEIIMGWTWIKWLSVSVRRGGICMC